MADYTQSTFFTPKDALSTGDPLKVIKGSYFDTEFSALSTAIATKVDDTGIINSTTGFAGLSAAPGADSISFWDQSAAAVAWLTMGTGLTFSGTTIALSFLGLEALVDPNADRIYFWDDSAGASAWLSLSGLSISGTTLSVSHLGFGDLADPNADNIVFWDDSAGALAWLTMGSGLSITTTSISVDHDAATNFVADEHIAHSGVTLTAGEGLSGGGTIAASRSFALDFTELTAIAGSGLAATDVFAVYDASAAAHKKLAYQDMGVVVQTAATQTLALDDANTLLYNSGATSYTVTVPLNATVAIPVGSFIALTNTSTGTQTVAATGGVTITSLGSLLTVQASGGFAVLIKVATDAWVLAGDLQ